MRGVEEVVAEAAAELAEPLRDLGEAVLVCLVEGHAG